MREIYSQVFSNARGNGYVEARNKLSDQAYSVVYAQAYTTSDDVLPYWQVIDAAIDMASE